MNREAADKSLALTKAVRVLPPGTEAAWMSYVDRQLASAIERDGDAVRIAALADNILGKTTIVSRNAPYSIDCDPSTGAAVWFFGPGDNSIMVPIFGATRIETREATPPPLGVDAGSIAARHLTNVLCERISSRLQEIMGLTPAAISP